MGKTLFIISLKYPLINAINIKINELENKKADIILDGNKNDYELLAKRLQKTNVFEKVYLVNPDGVDGIKKYFKQKEKANFFEAVRGTIRNVKLKREFNKDKEGYINHCIINGLMIDLHEYDELYVASETKVSWACADILASRKQISKIHLIEEGSRDYGYTDVIIKRRERYKDLMVVVHLYDPEVVAYDRNMQHISFQSIKKLQSDDNILVDTLNYTFGYKREKVDYQNKIIFFEQVAEPMPVYLKDSSGMLRLLLHNAYKKHQKEDNLFQEKSKVIRYILSLLKSKGIENRFMIKLHPRTVRGILPECADNIMGDRNNIHTIPWEVYCLNEAFRNNVWIAINSSSIVNRMVCFDKQEDVKYVILNGCEEILNSEFTPLEVFYRNIQMKYGEMLILPKNIKELEKIIV
ncbi:MAG: hypothetical protein MSQ83_05435 [Phascolarctobacterium sp.]|nr:hypothetical protein [Phascolarctobacterium sp.]